ncbi:MAG: ribokinase [Clostridia bacterium]|nr:ribokinase [Clostridia bacterium]
MKILNFGSLNLDYVYRMHDFIRPGETAAALSRNVVCGGKGLNQSIALARGGAKVYHAGNVGADDGWMLLEMLTSAGVDTTCVRKCNMPGGHTIIQVNDAGENAIILFPGANAAADPEQIRQVISRFDAGDLLILQNEISCIPEIIREAKARGMRIAMNPSPVKGTEQYPLLLLDFLFVNEDEAEHIAGTAEAADTLRQKYPGTSLIITYGAKGARYLGADGQDCWQPAVPVSPVDTTAAGDTFMGYFLAQWSQGADIARCLSVAAHASSLCILKPGAAPSIPEMAEVERFMAERASEGQP